MTAAFSTTRTNNAWRWAALFAWALVALVYLAFYLIDLRLDYHQIQVPCSGEACNYLAISTAEVAVLDSWGFSTVTYATIMTGVTALTVAGYWLLGGLILWRRGNSPIGLAVSLTLLVIPITLISDADNVAANFPILQVPSFFLSILGSTVLFLLLYLFPNGRFVPRWAPIPLVVSLVFFVTSMLAYSGDNPFLSNESPFFVVSIISSFILGVGFQIYRYLRVSSPKERLQTKWVLLGLIILMLGFPVWFIFFGSQVELQPGVPRLLGSIGGWFISMLTTLALPIALTIAILPYRLWDIDLIIRKTLIYAILTAGLLIVFLGSVVLLQSLFGALIGDRNSALITVVSTLAVAALFNPLRRRIQTFIDRRFYRQRYNAEKVLAAFSSSLRDEVDLERLQNAILDVVEETMQPASVSLWLRDAEFIPREQQRERNPSSATD